MELVPWKPFGELGSFRGEMDRLRDKLFGERPLFRSVTEEWLPSVDISETKDNFIVKAELPGLESKDVNVSISGDLLLIKGEKKRKRKRRTNTIIMLRDTPDPFSGYSNFRLPSKATTSRRPLTKVF